MSAPKIDIKNIITSAEWCNNAGEMRVMRENVYEIFSTESERNDIMGFRTFQVYLAYYIMLHIPYYLMF